MTTIHEPNLVTALRAKQAAEGLSDRQFAAKLGVSAALWNRTHRGVLAIGISLVDAATAVYPDLNVERDFSLRQRSTIRNSKRTNIQLPEAPR